MTYAKKQVIDSLKKGETILIHGNLGTGKTHLVKNIIPKLKNKSFYLSCPLEPGEFLSFECAITNNPKTNLILDNIEDADKATIQRLTKILNKKPKLCIIIAICTNLYDQHLKTIKTKFGSIIKMPLLQVSDAILYAEKNGANDKTIELISKQRPTDYRQLKNMIHFESSHTCLTKSELNTYLGFKNCFKSFEWLLGAKNNANLYEIIRTDSYFYQNSIHENYITHVKTIKDATNLTENMSISNLFNEMPEYRDNIIARLKSTFKTPTKFEVKFPRYIYHKKLYINMPTMDHYETFHFILNLANIAKPKKYILEHVKAIMKYYKLTPEYVEKCLTDNLFNKKIKIKANLKRTIYP